MKHVKLFINSLNPIVLTIIYVFVYIVKKKVQTKITNLKKSLTSVSADLATAVLSIQSGSLFISSQSGGP